MFYQKVVKGIKGLSDLDAKHMVEEEGIVCNWCRNAEMIENKEIKYQLTDTNLMHHLNDYDTNLPISHRWKNMGNTYGDVTPYISTTAGSVQRASFFRTNLLFPSFLTALKFATRNFTTNGYIFYAYLLILGKKAVPLSQFSEEVRELHIYTHYLPYHHEGEIVAKIAIPAIQIEKAVGYDGPAALSRFQSGLMPTPTLTLANPSYIDPKTFSNIRELL